MADPRMYPESVASARRGGANQNQPINKRIRVTAAQINAGFTLLSAKFDAKYRLMDAMLIAIGGNAATVTSVQIKGFQAGSTVTLIDALIAGLVRGTSLRMGSSPNALTGLDALGFNVNDANTPVTIIKNGTNLTGATAVDVSLSYVVE